MTVLTASSGWPRALLTGSWLTVGAALIALRAANTRDDPMTAGHGAPADEDRPNIDLTAVSSSD
jgi:hypothetical protein